MANEQIIRSMPAIIAVPPSSMMTTNVVLPVEKEQDTSTLRQRETLEQLSTNALAPYVPDLSKFENGGTVKTYTCSSCGDTFVCESNLEFHLNRRSVLINFNCDSCETVQVFYNRCCLLAHISSHVDKGKTSDIINAILLPLPRVMMDGMQSDFMKALENEDSSDGQEDLECLNPSKLLEVSMCEMEESGNVTPNNKADVSPSEKIRSYSLFLKNMQNNTANKTSQNNSSGSDKTPENNVSSDKGALINGKSYSLFLKNMQINAARKTSQNNDGSDKITQSATDNRIVQETSSPNDEKRICCSECKTVFKDEDERRMHFINDDKIPQMVHPCGKCGLICPSYCSRKAHNRLHLQVSPYVCPECGDNPDRYWEHFQKHLKYQCLHYSRTVGYRCKLCGSYSRSLIIFQKHCFTKHMIVLIKCNKCPMAFKSSKGFVTHNEKIHGILTMDEVTFSTIYSCGYDRCGIIIENEQKAFDHINTHIKETFYGYLFKCTECDLPFHTKEILHRHIQVHHSKIYTQFILGKNALENDTEKDYVVFNTSKIECLLCHCAFSSQQNYSLHITRSHSYGKHPCAVCGAPLRLRAEKIMHAKSHLRNNILLCLLCYAKPSPPETLSIHLLTHIARIKYATLCIICGKGLYNSKEAFQHLKSEHYLKISSVEVSKSIPTVKTVKNREKKKIVINNNIALNNSISLPIAPSTTSKSDNKHKLQSPNGQTPPLKKVKLETGHCFKCDVVNANRTEFKEHILTHKESPNSFQCMECGQCYISEPSLKLHLKINHSIEDADKYIASEGTNHTPEKEIIPETTKSNDLECSVCFETFTTDALLNTHLRSHGMAFIRAKRVSVA